MSSVITVRAATTDSTRLAPLFDSYRGFYGRPSDLVGAERFLWRRLQDGDSIVLYATAPGETSVFGFVQLYPTFSSLFMRPALVLNDLYVLPGPRRRGVARSLLRAAFDVAREQGAAYLQLQTERTNVAARRLYESEGYRLDEAFDHYELEV